MLWMVKVPIFRTLRKRKDNMLLFNAFLFNVILLCSLLFATQDNSLIVLCLAVSNLVHLLLPVLHCSYNKFHNCLVFCFVSFFVLSCFVCFLIWITARKNSKSDNFSSFWVPIAWKTIMILDQIIFNTAFNVSEIFWESEYRSELQYTQQTWVTALLYLRSFQESRDKSEPVIALSILMSGKRKISMNINPLKMWMFKVTVCRENMKVSSVSDFYMHRSCCGSVAHSKQ